MITYYLGIPGSGKSYAGIDIIFNNFSDHPKAKKDLKKEYISCYTNVNGIKFQKLSNVFDLDAVDENEHNKLLRSIEILHSAYKAKLNDDCLIRIAKEENIYKTLFVIDECHNIFSERKAFLIWWLTYHRHLYQDIILITQNLALVDSKYKVLAEYFYKATPKSLSLNPKIFSYKTYIDARMTKASKAGEKKVIKRKEVFELYQSGDGVETKNIILKYLLISLSVAIFLFFAFSMYLSNMGGSDKKTSKENKSLDTVQGVPPPRPVDNIAPSVNSNFEDRLFKLVCTRNDCLIFNNEIPFTVFEKLHNVYDLEIISIEKTRYTREIYFLASKEFPYLFKKEDYEVLNSSVSISPASE